MVSAGKSPCGHFQQGTLLQRTRHRWNLLNLPSRRHPHTGRWVAPTCWRLPEILPMSSPIGSMYGIYTNIGGIFMVNVTIYSIHGSYGSWTSVMGDLRPRNGTTVIETTTGKALLKLSLGLHCTNGIKDPQIKVQHSATTSGYQPKWDRTPKMVKMDPSMVQIQLLELHMSHPHLGSVLELLFSVLVLSTVVVVVVVVVVVLVAAAVVSVVSLELLELLLLERLEAEAGLAEVVTTSWAVFSLADGEIQRAGKQPQILENEDTFDIQP